MYEELRQSAMETRDLYRMGEIDKKEAQKRLKPYIERFNQKSEELAKKYNVRPQRFSFSAFMR